MLPRMKVHFNLATLPAPDAAQPLLAAQARAGALVLIFAFAAVASAVAVVSAAVGKRSR